MRGSVIVGAALAAWSTSNAAVASPCSTDAECEGDLVCEHHVCVDQPCFAVLGGDRARFDGSCVNGLAIGGGSAIFAAGRYVGEFRAGKPNGRGRLYYFDGREYEGNWAEGVWQGSGIVSNPDGSRVEGEWERGSLRQRTFDSVAEALGGPILKCLHPTGTFRRVRVTKTSVSDDEARIEMTIWWDGKQNPYFSEVALYLNRIAGGRVELVRENSQIPGGRTCRLSNWTPLSQFGSEAAASMQRLVWGSVGAAAAVAAYLSDEQARDRVKSCLADKAIAFGANEAAKAAVSNPLAQRTLASVLKQTYKGEVVASATARDVAISSFKDELRKENPALADAVEVGSFGYCLFK